MLSIPHDLLILCGKPCGKKENLQEMKDVPSLWPIVDHILVKKK